MLTLAVEMNRLTAWVLPSSVSHGLNTAGSVPSMMRGTPDSAQLNMLASAESVWCDSP